MRSEDAPLRVLLVSHGSRFGGGAEWAFDEVVEALELLPAPGLDRLAVFPGPGEMARSAKRHGAKTILCPLPRWADFGLRSPVSRFLRALSVLVAVVPSTLVLAMTRPDLVVTNTMTIPTFALAARWLRIPHIWMVHEFGEADHDLGFVLDHRRTVGLIAALSEVVVCCSESVAEHLRDVQPMMNTTVVYGAVKHGSLAPRQRPPTRSLRAILVGRISESKGQTTAVAAVALARDGGTSIELQLVGPHDDRELRRLVSVIEQFEVQDRVHVVGSSTDTASWLAGADVALMCSRQEAFGRVTIEAMRMGLPVCGTRSGGTPEIIREGVNGLLFDTDDAAGLASCLTRLTADEDLRFRLAQGAYRTAGQYGLERLASDLRTAFDAARRRP